jgi:hypothetical protein
MAFKRLDTEDFIVSADSITAPAWSAYSPTLINMYTSSVQAAGTSGNYYLNIYQFDPVGASGSQAETQFNIAYGNKNGSGSLLYNAGINGLSPTRTIYGQFRNLIYGDENANFSFNEVTQNDFYALTIDRARYKQSLFPGSLNLTLYSGSSQIVLTDNSNDVLVDTYLDCGRVYQIVTGSNGTAVSTGVQTGGSVSAGMTISGSYGLFLPDIGTIILNAAALDLPFISGGINLGTQRTSNTNVNNPARLYSTGSGRIGLTTGSFTSSFALNSQETITSDFVFVRARNAEFNYSENPSFISGSTGTILYDAFIQNPQTYITTVGMYNDNNELLAVAKLSKPLKKDFTKEALIRVKLDF